MLAQFSYVQDINQKYEYGLYEEHSQDIIPYNHCLLHEDIMDEILQYIQSYLRKYRVSIYDRKRHKGLLRHVLGRRGGGAGRAGGGVVIYIILNHFYECFFISESFSIVTFSL